MGVVAVDEGGFIEGVGVNGERLYWLSNGGLRKI
jgi:hypothetical protein